jgi:hypothetical protein
MPAGPVGGSSGGGVGGVGGGVGGVGGGVGGVGGGVGGRVGGFGTVTATWHFLSLMPPATLK